MQLTSHWHARTPYSDGLLLQEKYWSEAVSSKKIFIMGCEHPGVITRGKREAKSENLMHSSLPIVDTDRGGQVTIHSEGQLVIYPIVPIRHLQMGVRDYICIILKATQKFLKKNGIDSRALEAPAGVFTAIGKIAFVGVRVQNGVTRHGVSINVSNDLELFRQIVPCGIAGQSMDKLANYHEKIELCALFNQWVREFSQVLDQTASIGERGCF